MREPSSHALKPSLTWNAFAIEIGEHLDAGEHFTDIMRVAAVIKLRTLEPYIKHRNALDALIWYDDPKPKTVIEFGAGYGAMATFWPSNSTVFNVDLPTMLGIQKTYLLSLPGAVLRNGNLGANDYDIVEMPGNVLIYLIPFTDADALPFDGAYLFATWSLTETTPETWEYYIDKAPRLAGIYAVGWHGWIDLPGKWPWDRLRAAFQTIRADMLPYRDYDGAPTDSVELAAVNR